MRLWLCVVALIFVNASLYAEETRKADAVILSYDMTFDMASPSSGTMKAHRKVIVMNRKGLSSALFSVYTDSFRSLSSFSGRIEAGGKTLRKLKSSDLNTVLLADGIATDAFVSFYEPNAPYPFTVEYEYEVSYRKGFVSFPAFIPVSAPDVAAVQTSYTLSVPPGTRIQYNASAEPEKSADGKKDIYRWRFDGYSGYVYEHLMPDVLDFVPYVYSGPVAFEYAGTSGSLSDWKDLGVWLYGLQKGLVTVPAELKTKVEALTSGLDSDRAKIKALYDYLRENTRYVSIQLGIGGFRPFPVETVYKTGFGDCKALSVYMQALLDVAGIKSDYLIVNTDEEDLVQDFHTPGQMNHAMLSVPMESDTLWIECTNPRYPLGYRHDAVAGHQVVLVKEDGGELVRVKSYPDSLRLRSESVEVRLGADGKASCKGSRLLLLDNAEAYIGFRTLDSKAQFNAIMSGNSLNPTDFSITSVYDNFNDWVNMKPGEEYVPEVRVGYSYDVKDYAKASGDRIFMPLNPFAKSISTDRSARVNDIERKYAASMSDTVRVALPSGYIPESLPTSDRIESPFGSFVTEVDYDEEKGSVTVVQTLRLIAGRFPKDAYSDYRTFARSVSRAYDGRIVLVKQ